ncbi:MAG: TonB-dependent receptor, partial [Mariprofundaceae bacterium]|nr:TonB-dependent receptor [Mariprofundaceae bacterium]
PSWLVLDAVASYRWRDMEAFVRIDNLTNEKYSSYGVFSPGFPPFIPASDNFYPSPEIGVRAGVSYTF